MPYFLEKLSAKELTRYSRAPLKCPRLPYKISGLSDYFSAIDHTTKGNSPFWFRGHADFTWKLAPFALRYPKEADRKNALGLIAEFKRVAEIKIEKPPQRDEELKWVQIAQHYGLPTRLLDWTESPTMALYFCCCEKASNDGVVYILNPIDLNRATFPKRPRVLNSHADEKTILRYLKAGPKKNKRGTNPVAVNPVWNSNRLMLQRGTFTLHGGRFELDKGQAASLVAIPILKEFKGILIDQLQRIGVDEMNIFPELEHSCSHLKRKAGLPLMEW
jgi:hypothetical protein